MVFNDSQNQITLASSLNQTVTKAVPFSKSHTAKKKKKRTNKKKNFFFEGVKNFILIMMKIGLNDYKGSGPEQFTGPAILLEL